MKFGKELEKLMVQEWEEYYVDYNGLKHMLREIKRSKHNNNPHHHQQHQEKINGDLENQTNEEDDDHMMFFKKVDEEMKKVCGFYDGKVDEVKEEGSVLLKQMEALIALRKNVKMVDEVQHTHIAGKTLSRPASTSSSDLDGGSTEIIKSDDDDDKPDSLELIHQLTIDPKSNVQGILEEFKQRNLSFTKQDFEDAEGRLKLAFLDFCHKIHHLKQYSFINLSAFSKILKKYDQISSTSTRQSFMNKVGNSYLGNSDEITVLLNKVEHIYAKHFSYAKSREGKKLLRPRQKREKHTITFLSGFLFGCSFALLVAVVLLVQTRKLLDKESAKIYMDNIFPLYSLYAFIILHMLVHAADIYLWRRYRINYPFIFGFEQGTELSYREIFLISNTLAVLVLSTFLVQLHFRMDSKPQQNESNIEFIPLGLLIGVVVIIFCPFNILFRSTRFFLIKCFFRSICAPFFKVTLPDFYLADQLTSQVLCIRNLQYYVCFYGWRTATQKQMKCQSLNGYIAFYYILSVLPYWFRLLQCLRRVIEEKNKMQACTALRYLVTVMAVIFQTLCRVRNRTIYKILGLIVTIITTVVSVHADVVLDWGLLRWKSKNKLLRDRLLVPHKSVYFIAIVLDVILRFAWVQLLLDFDMRPMRRQATPFLITVVEILRRGIWNFFWLENEQLNNVGKYRAFKSVPPPPIIYRNKGDKVGDDDKEEHKSE